MVEVPGLKYKWYVLPNMICELIPFNSSGEKVFTAPTVPTGINTGVLILPCPVLRAPVLALE